MKNIIDLIERKQETIEKNNHLCQWLSDESIDPHERLSFFPAMAYFNMGFPDAMETLYRENPINEIEKLINTYCQEDSEHWRWYLTDLEKLGFSLSSWGNSIPTFFKEVWSPATIANRKIIILIMNYGQRNDDPLLRLVVIRILEAGATILISNLRKAAIAMGMDDKLLYCGKVHYQEELHHTVQPSHLLAYELSDETRALAVEAVENMLDLIDELYNCWYEQRNKYQFKQPVLPQK